MAHNNVFYSKNTKSLATLCFPYFILFLVTFIILGCIYPIVSFKTDDFGIIWHSQINSWQDIIKFFTGSGTLAIVQPSNFRPLPQDFFSVFFRPISYVFYALQTFFFNFQPQYYFLVKIFFHSINTVLLYYLFSLLTHYQILSFLGALSFAFHPTLAGPGGICWITLQAHVINVTLILFCILLLKKYLDLDNLLLLAAALLTFLIALFHIETPLFFPLIVLPGIYRYKKNLYQALKIGLSFVFASLGYLAVRFYLYPPQNSGAGYSFLDRINPITFLQNRFFDMINLCCDLAYIPWLGEGHKVIKIIILSIFIGIVLFLFFSSKQKKLHFFLFASFFIMMWPALIRYYATRYLYAALPFFLLFCLSSLASFFHKNSNSLKKIILICIGLFIGINGLIVINSLQIQSKESFILKTALEQLKGNKEIIGKNLCFVGLPMQWFRTGITHAVWMLGINNKLLVCNDEATTIIYNNPHFALNTKPITNGFRLTILNAQDATFWNFKDANLCMGDSFIHKRDAKTDRILDMSYTLDKEWLDKKPFFITWDYENNLFKIIGYIKQV